MDERDALGSSFEEENGRGWVLRETSGDDRACCAAYWVLSFVSSLFMVVGESWDGGGEGETTVVMKVG